MGTLIKFTYCTQILILPNEQGLTRTGQQPLAIMFNELTPHSQFWFFQLDCLGGAKYHSGFGAHFSSTQADLVRQQKQTARHQFQF
jgi:hypothetical protein